MTTGAFIMSGSRIWLDLSALFSCVRKQSCIFIDHEKHKTVKDVESHICHVFGVVPPVHILNDGWLLPPSESSLLLRDNDTVSVVPDGEPKICKSEHVAKSVATKSDTIEISSTSPVPHDPGLPNGNGPVNTKESITISLKNRNPFAIPSSADSDTIRKVVIKDSSQNNQLPTKQVTSPTTHDQDEDMDTNSEVGSGERKRKRIRRRKKKSVQGSDAESTAKEIRPSRYQTNKLLQGVSHILNTSLAEIKRKHIFFNEEQVNLKNSLEADASPKPVCDERSKVLAINSVSGNSSLVDKPPPVFSPTISPSVNVEGGLSKLLSLGNQKCPAVFERKKPETTKTSETFSPQRQNKPSTIKLTPLSTLPVKETIIQFKILKMCNYSPVLSETIKARVISPDSTSNQIYAKIIEGLSELQTEKGKFSLEQEDENDDAPVSEYLFLNWHDLLEPNAVEYC